MPSVIARDGQMEGIPVAVMEAMASRLPVVASSLSGLPEAVVHGCTGRLVEPGCADELARAIEDVLADPAAAREMGERGRVLVEREFRLEACVRELLQHIDRWNPPPVDADSLLRLVRRSGTGAGPIGVRRRIERRDSRIVHLLVKNEREPYDAILKFHASRAGESRPAAERARKEFDALVQLARTSTAGLRVPRPLHLDPEEASLLMEPCRGTPLEALIRTSRFARDRMRTRTLLTAVERTGSWLRHFQETTPHPHCHDVIPALMRLVDSAAEHLEQCRGNVLPLSAVGLVRSQLDGLKARLAPGSLRLTQVHGDFWPGNVFVEDDLVEVIDFEGMRDGLPYEDVAYFLVQLEQFFPGPLLQAQFKPLGSAFLAGYLPDSDGFDWPAYELCRIATALRMLSATSRASGVRALWRQRMLRDAIVGGTA
jgi:tRNA A-37 threonylcarbamoyl transferase component Bud32